MPRQPLTDIQLSKKQRVQQIIIAEIDNDPLNPIPPNKYEARTLRYLRRVMERQVKRLAKSQRAAQEQRQRDQDADDWDDGGFEDPTP